MPRRLLALAAWSAVWLAGAHVWVEAAGLRFHQLDGNESIAALAAFAERPTPIDVAFVGSSRVRTDVSVAALEAVAGARLGREVRAFNFGVQGGGAVDAYVVARDLVLAGEPPRMIVVGLGARSLNTNNPRYERTIERVLAPGDLLGTAGPGLRWSEIAAGVRAGFRATETLLGRWSRRANELRSSELELRGSEWPAPAEPWSGALPPRASELTEALGPRRTDERRADLQRRTLHRIDVSRTVLLRDYDPSGRGSWALRRLAALCRERGVELVVWNLPVSRAFRRGAYADGEYGRYMTELTRICREERVELHDLARPPFLFPDLFFRDGDHLSPIGADAFTRMVTARLIVPRLAR